MAKGHTDDDVVYDEEGRASLKEDYKNNNIDKPLRILLILKVFLIKIFILINFMQLYTFNK